jgi:hypothetical protein
VISSGKRSNVDFPMGSVIFAGDTASPLQLKPCKLFIVAGVTLPGLGRDARSLTFRSLSSDQLKADGNNKLMAIIILCFARRCSMMFLLLFVLIWEFNSTRWNFARH